MKRLIAALALFLAACTSTGGTTPAQTVFATKTAYEASLRIAVAYRELPGCTATPKPPCADPDIVAQLRHAQPAVRSALDAAELAVRTQGPLGGNVMQTALAAADAALKAFSALTTNLRTK